MEVTPRPLFLVLRNTLAVVILVYAVYLSFEFHTLWFRAFPKGFYFSGYKHEGAAWLTIGLALATSILSLIFRGRDFCAIVASVSCNGSRPRGLGETCCWPRRSTIGC